MNKYKTQEQLIKALSEQIKNRPRVLYHALERLYSLQSLDEQESKATKLHNGVGFTFFDAEILTSFAEQVKRGRELSEKQYAIAVKLLPKYARQLIRVSLNEGLIRKVDGYYQTTGGKK